MVFPVSPRAARASVGHYYRAARAHDGRWWRFDDEGARVVRGNVERLELRCVHLMVYTRPRGQARFAHRGPLLAPGASDRAGLDAAWVTRELQGWALETWLRRARAFLDGRKADVDGTTRIAVTEADAARLRDGVLGKDRTAVLGSRSPF